jgi:hypothetical protein
MLRLGRRLREVGTFNPPSTIFVPTEQTEAQDFSGNDDLVTCCDELVAAILAGLYVDPVGMFQPPAGLFDLTENVCSAPLRSIAASRVPPAKRFALPVTSARDNSTWKNSSPRSNAIAALPGADRLKITAGSSGGVFGLLGSVPVRPLVSRGSRRRVPVPFR